MSNIDEKVAKGFGDEWSTFRQGERELTPEQRQAIFDNYFAIFPWHALPKDGGTGLDAGCGSGRWSMGVAPRVKHLHALDASADALGVARQNLARFKNVTFHHATPAVPEAHELLAVDCDAFEDRSTDHCVEAGAVAAAGKNANFHVCSLMAWRNTCRAPR